MKTHEKDCKYPYSPLTSLVLHHRGINGTKTHPYINISSATLQGRLLFNAFQKIKKKPENTRSLSANYELHEINRILNSIERYVKE